MPSENNASVDAANDILNQNPFPSDDFIKTSSISNDKPKKIKIEDDDLNVTDDDGWLDILGSGDLKKKVLKLGKGPDSRPQRGNWVTLNLIEKIGEEEIENLQNFRFTLGDCEVVQGLDVSVSLMEEGETATIIVPARLGYGKVGKPPNIPPDSQLKYEVELVNIEEETEEKLLPYEERLKIGDQKRERGNFWYSRGDFSNSIHCYRRALEFLDEDQEVLDKDEDKFEVLLQLRLKVYNNLTAAQLKLEAYDAALKSVDFVLKVQPNNVKALFRKGKILGAKDDIEEAIKFLKKALMLEPETKIIHQELAKLLNKKKQEEKAERDLYKKMLGQDNKPIKKEVSTSKVRLWLQRFGVILSSIIVVAVGIAVYKHSTH